MYKNLFYFKYFTKWETNEIMSMYPFEKEIFYQLYVDQKQHEAIKAKDSAKK